MKKMYFLLLSTMVLLQSCVKRDDGSSIWAGGAWIVPTLTFGAAIVFGVLAYLSRKSGSNKIIGGKVTNEEGGKVRWNEMGYTIFAVGCLIATIVIVWVQIAER